MPNPSIFNREEFVRVTNETGELITGRFASDDYEFPPGEATDIHLAAAAHMFGFGEEDKSRALARLGWVHSSADIRPAMERLGHIKFEDVPGIEKVTSIKKLPPARAPSLQGEGTEGGALAPPEDPLEAIDGEDDEGANAEVM
jgi:hypothetical protein